MLNLYFDARILTLRKTKFNALVFQCLYIFGARNPEMNEIYS